MVKVYVDGSESKPASWAFVDRDNCEYAVRPTTCGMTAIDVDDDETLLFYCDDIPLLIKALSAAYEAGGG